MDDRSIEYLHSLAPKELWELYKQSQQIRDYVDQDYELYSKFWYGSVYTKNCEVEECKPHEGMGRIYDQMRCKYEIISWDSRRCDRWFD
jgi:hypothetical protein